MTIFTVHYAYDARSEVRDQVRPEHRRFLGGLHEAGVLLSSGPFTGPPLTESGPGAADDSTEGAMIILHGESAEAVLAQLDEDPFHLGGLIAERTVRPWNPVMGAWA